MLGVGARLCAVPLAHAVETMRPLPVAPVAGMPPYVLGLAVVRGTPTPVVHLARLIGDESSGPVSRWVTVRADHRVLALAVESVLGARRIDPLAMVEVPGLVGSDGARLLESVGRLDGALLVVLRTVRILPAAAWGALAARAEAP